MLSIYKALGSIFCTTGGRKDDVLAQRYWVVSKYTLDKLFHLSELKFPDLENKNDINASLKGDDSDRDQVDDSDIANVNVWPWFPCSICHY